ncbi:bifunctional 4-hydroxy-2-oxoglutarate aldolase/2-dehydro-3-deoxy-phosphogluconate aldolase [Pedobacter quisquiliarum]|jgi:2-dehydro-3-deoxyphosphogluconate aldolase/(4S)-4-hydroxy-2-oxoglutarate aldolase|uniref:Bifunctional 4-hydroxy-2-oxoglutarate aldolase/2-dehydro-3-deoxy-phosphogluconate aldolase n=1 Tax=Pedobacter quisquiliarum TaxID=1834438 RepID=A0A916XAG1_9SPHI|nr:bifunctional 4-hydroxy-2-oxoglutarate aldolase/2-dehydro-3-deoxy-phosphogluconate aldolase [Pedobacter quisquiliarum]GGC56190.1 bifunctional 4-hydroxy-2-oxoglutarate aldolase/2-dehydro-3-deoxy-phosphogluconate aldolase [Pedobacter quisquiliarum]
MKKTKEEILATLLNQGLLPLFYLDSAAESAEILKALYRAGVKVFEYTNRGSAALENFKQLVALKNESMPDLQLGIGTIKTPQEAKDFIQAGADFLVSPIINPEVGQLANEAGLLWIPGCMTPTEIDLAQKHGALLIKIFPANILGPEYIASIRELFPGQHFIPTGGVDLSAANIRAWFAAGVSAVGMGSKLISKKIIQEKAYTELQQHTETVLQTIKDNR